MSGKKHVPLSTAAQAARLIELLASTEPAAAKAREESAAKHIERERRPRRGAGAKRGEAEASFAERAAASAKGAAASAERAAASAKVAAASAKVAAASLEVAAASLEVAAASAKGAAAVSGARGYLHRGPTRSLVLNAFLHALGGRPVVPANVDIFNEHTLAPRLLELARPRLVAMLLSVGKTEAGLALAAETRPILNERAGRLFLRKAVDAGGDLGAIARDYEEHCRRPGASEADRRAGCIMAAFAGQLLSLAEKSLGPHVRDELRTEIALWTSQGNAPARRRRRVSELSTQGAERPAAPEEAARAASSPGGPRGRSGR
jgi:hypothetical protein